VTVDDHCPAMEIARVAVARLYHSWITPPDDGRPWRNVPSKVPYNGTFDGLQASSTRLGSGGSMDVMTLMKRPSGFLPVAMSFAALAIVLGHVAMFGAVRQADEGTAAHLFQLLLAAQVPIVVFFAIRWLPENPRQALPVLALQAAAGLLALAPVFFFNL